MALGCWGQISAGEFLLDRLGRHNSNKQKGVWSAQDLDGRDGLTTHKLLLPRNHLAGGF